MHSDASLTAVSSTSLLEIRESGIHGRGVFAAAVLLPGIRLIEYVGRKVTKAESKKLCEQNNEYIFSLDEEFDIDGNVEWNPARLINHSCDPNCEAQLVEGRVWIIPIRRIEPGEEISFNYGYDLEDYHEHPCRCGAAQCVGFIVAEEHFETVRRREARTRGAR